MMSETTMVAVEFELLGQVVRCERQRVDGASGAWTVVVDGAVHGPAFLAADDDDRDDVIRRAAAWLHENRAIRVPDPPWQWSVMDRDGREWWARLTTPYEFSGPLLGRELILRDCIAGVEERIPWPETLPPPRAAELRRMLGA